MTNIDKIKELMTQSKSIEELVDSLMKTDIPACYMKKANETFIKEHDIKSDKEWHRFFVETGLTPVNKWENISQFTIILISDDLQEMKIIEYS